MPTTTVLDGDGTDWTAAVRALGARTDNAGTAVTDLAADEDRLINHILTEGFLTTEAFVVQDGATGMQVTVGSGTAKADIYVVAGDDVGQHPYLVRMDNASVTITLDAGDADPRIDEIYLVVRDATYDGGTVTEAQLGYRKGDAAASPTAPGPDAAWDAEALLATINVAAAASTVAAGDIIDSRSATRFTTELDSAKVAGDTFTGPVTFQSLGTFENGAKASIADNTHGPTTGQSSYPTGLSWMGVTTGAWPGTPGVVLTVNNGNNQNTFQLFYDMSGAASNPVMYLRRWSSGSSSWGSWVTFAAAENPGNVQVGSVVASPNSNFGTSFTTVADVTFTPPSGWNTYTLVAHGSIAGRVTSTADNAEVRCSIGGVGGTAAQLAALHDSHYGLGASQVRTGLSGNVTAAIQGRKDTASGTVTGYSGEVSFTAYRTS